ncbi:MAG TPA: UDP-glucose 4-epimerase [Runella sp.]|nr:UDP-glucose 4-epimerase [Runella sp.]HAO49211.1 UDP-glucose 4-epimerase [Runella sp.]
MSGRVLITGASGFIGYHLIEAAQKAGLEVHAAVRPSSDVSHLAPLAPVFVYPDYRSTDALRSFLEKGQYQYIIHSAGATRAKDSATYNLINAEYTRRLAEAACQISQPLERFVFVSSLAALGPLSYAEKQPITENTPPMPVTDYGKSKLLAEHYLAEIKGLRTSIIRPTAVYGPREKDVFILFKTLNSGIDAYIGRGAQRFSFVYVKDLADATVKAALHKSTANHAFNVSDGGAYNRYELAEIFNSWSGKKPVRIHIPLGLMKIVATTLEVGYTFSKNTPVVNREKLKELTAQNWFCSIDAAQSQLGYQPKYDLKRGLLETLTWYRENQWL